MNESDLASLFDQLDPASLLPRLCAGADGVFSSQELVSKWKQRLETCRQALEEEVTHNNDDNDNKLTTPEIPIVVVESLARSRFLTTDELGRFLLQTTPSITRALGKDAIYKYLCWNECQATYQIPKAIVQQSDDGYQHLFQHFVVEPRRRRRIRQLVLQNDEIEEPSKSPPNLFQRGQSSNAESFVEGYVLLISVRDDSTGVELLSKCLCGKPLKQFLTKGELNLHLSDPLPVPTSFRRSPPNWRALLHLWSPKQLTWFLVHDSSSCSYGEFEYYHDETLQLSTPPPVPPPTIARLPTLLDGEGAIAAAASTSPEDGAIDQGYLEFVSSSHIALTETGQVYLALLQERRKQHVQDRSTIEGIKFEPTLMCSSLGEEDANVVAQELRLDIWIVLDSGAAVLFDSPYHCQKYGVDLHRFLEHLKED